MKRESAPSPVVTHIVSGDLWAGAEVQVYSLLRALKSSDNLSVTAVVFNKGILRDKLEALGIPVELADETRLSPFQIARVIKNHCVKHKTRVVHTHGFKENVLGIIGKDLARVPYSVRTVHGNPETAFSISRPQAWLVSRLDVLLGRLRQQAVVAVSSQLEQRLNTLFPGKVHKIYNFIDPEEYADQARSNRDLNGSVPKIGIVGRLVPVKRVDIFIETITQLNRQGTYCKGVIIGSGPLESELRQRAKALGVESLIEFKGFVNPARKEIAKLDLLLMTSDHEGLPMTLLEAMALEVPVVAHRVGGIPEVLDSGNCGWLVDDHSVTGYATTTRKALESNEDRNRKAQAGAVRIRDLFSSPKNTAAYKALYRL